MSRGVFDDESSLRVALFETGERVPRSFSSSLVHSVLRFIIRIISNHLIYLLVYWNMLDSIFVAPIFISRVLREHALEYFINVTHLSVLLIDGKTGESWPRR